MTSVRRPARAIRLALMTGVAVGGLTLGQAHAQPANQGYPVGSTASALAAQTFRGEPSPVPSNPAMMAPSPAVPTLGGAPVPGQTLAPRFRTPEEIREDEEARAAADRAAAIDDGLGPDGFYLEADLVIRDDKAKTVTARGGVESRYDGRTLRANEVVYDQTTGIITARGNAQLVDALGNAEFADELVLDDERSTGFARNFSARLENNTTMAASTAVRRSASVIELNNALYTPCPICADQPDKKPSWSFRAAKVVEDRERQVVYYRKATFYLWGVPTFHVPVFWHTSPAAKRKSGFLAPQLQVSKRRGFSYEQPYLQLLTESSDIIVSPQLNTKVNPFLNLNYRQRLWSGQFEVRGGFTRDQFFDFRGDKFGEQTWRSYVFAKGRFDLSDTTVWGFTVQRASDDVVFDDYDIGDILLAEARGLFPDQERRLSSQLYGVRQDDRSYLSVSAINIQSVIPGENDRVFPLIAPLVEARWDPETPILGGRLRTRAQAVVLTREQSDTISPGANDPRPMGIDSRRAAGDFDWRANVTMRQGLRLSPFLQGRFAVYDISEIHPQLGPEEALTAKRAQGVAGVDLSMPFARRIFERGALVLEPLAQVALSPESRGVRIGTRPNGDPIYFNEDSIAFEFEETNLLRPNKFPGFDIYEGGQRVSLAGRASYVSDGGQISSIFVGRTFRRTEDPIIPTRSGLATKSSDWIVAAQLQPMSGFNLVARTRLDSETKEVRRIETLFDLSNRFGEGSVAYRKDVLDINGEKIQSLNGRLQLNVTRNWRLAVSGDRSIEEGFWRRRDIGILYTDECITINFTYSRADQFANTPTGQVIQPNHAFSIGLNLATLGGTGYADD